MHVHRVRAVEGVIEAAHRRETFDRAIAAARTAVQVVAATETDDVLRREGVELRHGWASFREPGLLDIDGSVLRANNVVIATGARPAVPPIDGLDAVDYLTNETVWALDAVPASLAVLGGGAVGCELAQAFARLGTTVTLIEALDRILPREDPDASAVITDALRADGVTVHTGRLVVAIETLGPTRAARLHLAGGETVGADRLLVAVGRVGAIDGFGLDVAGVETVGGSITTDDTLATTAKGVWAVGDVTGKLPFTHAADEMGRIAAHNALHRLGRRRFRTDAVPRVTFPDPEVAQVGITEPDATNRHGRVAYLPMSEVDRAIAAQETAGFVKLITGPRRLLRNTGGGRLVGATIVASRAGEMIHEPALAMRTGMFTGRLAQTVHAYPTWSVAVRHAAAQFFIQTGGRSAGSAGRR